MSKITLHRQNQAFHFSGTNESGAVVQLDGSPDIGGENKGLRPMEHLLAALGGCSAIDIGLILAKQKQVIDDWSITVEGERDPDDEKPAKPFTKIHLHFAFTGQLDPKKVKRAIDLSLDKYCSVAVTLRAFAEITYSYAVNEEIGA